MPRRADAEAAAPNRAPQRTSPANVLDGARIYTSESDMMEDELGNHNGGATGSERWDSARAGGREWRGRKESSQASVSAGKEKTEKYG